MTLCKCGCGQSIPPGRTSYAGPRCHGRWRHQVHNHNESRRMLFDRDGGVCLMCGCDTIAKRAEYITRLAGKFPEHLPGVMDQIHPELRPYGFPSLRNSWWEGDHEVPIIEGGTSRPQDYRTLCYPCHKKETRKLACRRAEKRRAGATTTLPL